MTLVVSLQDASIRNMSVRERMAKTLEQLGYDFSHFSLGEFAAWLSNQRQREIRFVGRTMPPNLYGAYVRGESRDYIFYDQNTALVHQLHIQLHELAHIICRHGNEALNEEMIAILLRQDSNEMNREGLLRSQFTDTNEEEAETLAGLIIERSVRANRDDELLAADHCVPGFNSYWSLVDR